MLIMRVRLVRVQVKMVSKEIQGGEEKGKRRPTVLTLLSMLLGLERFKVVKNVRQPIQYHLVVAMNAQI